MAESIYEQVGGDRFFFDLVEGFYRLVEDDVVLRPMYPAELGPAKERLALFLIQYFGGSHGYDERRGEPKLRLRHLRFAIDDAARNNWMDHMTAALRELDVSEEVESELLDYFDKTSRFLMNRGLSIGGSS